MKWRSEEDTVGLNVKAPPEWDRFLETVAAENRGFAHPYAGIAIEQTWTEYRNDHRVREDTNSILEAAGLPRRGWKKENPTRAPSSDDGRRTTIRVLEEVKTEMASYATENDVPLHEVVRSVVNWYLDGGLLGKVSDKLGRAEPEVEKAFAALHDDDGKPGIVERRTSRIANRLGPSFSEDDLEDAIREEGNNSAPSIKKYTKRILESDYTDVKRWPRSNQPDLYFPPDVWANRKTSQIIGNLGGGNDESPPSFTREEFARAAKGAGIEVKDANRKEVNEYLNRVLNRLGFEWDDEAGRFTPNGSATAEDSDDGEEAADAEFDTLQKATAVTDGGGQQ